LIYPIAVNSHVNKYEGNQYVRNANLGKEEETTGHDAAGNDACLRRCCNRDGNCRRRFNNLRGGVAADDMASKTLLLASNIQKHWRNAGSYTTLTAEAVDKIALVEKPLRMQGTSLLDAWGNTMGISGGQSAFSITIGGATNPINKEDCATLANNLSSIATSIRVGADAAVGSGATAGTITGVTCSRMAPPLTRQR